MPPTLKDERVRVHLTKKQAEILAWIAAFVRKSGYAPSIDEIAAHFGIWRSGIQQHLGLIEKKGYIKRVPGIARGLVVL